MISLPHAQPLLLVGDLPMEPCDEEWIRQRVEEAARAAGRGEFWLAGDIARGMMEYLTRNYQGTVIPLPALLDRLRALLAKLDCADVAAHLDPSPPPPVLRLAELAREAGNGFELHFFAGLRRHLEACAAHGARTVRVRDLRPCVRHLRGTGKWRKDCEALAREILAFISSHRISPTLEPHDPL
jgi:hypothetical protein